MGRVLGWLVESRSSRLWRSDPRAWGWHEPGHNCWAMQMQLESFCPSERKAERKLLCKPRLILPFILYTDAHLYSYTISILFSTNHLRCPLDVFAHMTYWLTVTPFLCPWPWPVSLNIYTHLLSSFWSQLPTQATWTVVANSYTQWKMVKKILFRDEA